MLYHLWRSARVILSPAGKGTSSGADLQDSSVGLTNIVLTAHVVL